MKIFQLTPRFAFSDFPTEADLDTLRGKWNCLVTLSTKRPAEAVIDAMRNYRYVPIPDGKKIPVEETAYVARMVLSWLREDERNNVIVHCYGGRNRSGLVAAYVLMGLEDISGAEAIRRIDAVSKKRDGGARALVNPYFRAFLEAYAP